MSDRAIASPASKRLPGIPNARFTSQADPDDGPGSTERGFFHDADAAEVALLLPSGQAVALERDAHRRGLTVGELLRRLIRDYLVSDALPPEAFVIDREEDNLPDERAVRFFKHRR